jgi:hypothetical protein
MGWMNGCIHVWMDEGLMAGMAYWDGCLDGMDGWND